VLIQKLNINTFIQFCSINLEDYQNERQGTEGKNPMEVDPKLTHGNGEFMAIQQKDNESLSSVPYGYKYMKIARRKYLTAWWTPVNVQA